MSECIYLIAEFEPKLGCDEKLWLALCDLVPLSLQDKGVKKYVPTKQIDYPDTTLSKFTIVMHEEYKDIEALEHHNRQPHMQNFINTYIINPETSLVANCNVRIFTQCINVGLMNHV